MCIGTFWKQFGKIYALEIESRSRDKAWLTKLCKGWRQIGEGTTKNDMFIFLFQRSFETDEQFNEWKRSMEIPLFELKASGEKATVNKLSKDLKRGKLIIPEKQRKSRKFKDKIQDIAAMHTLIQPIKKTRGRPKGSKNKPKISAS